MRDCAHIRVELFKAFTHEESMKVCGGRCDYDLGTEINNSNKVKNI